jgi:hypothetical protein
VFIELTDLLRCPRPHDEGFLVLIPDRLEGRRVQAGHLGCPACGWTTAWNDGVPVLDDTSPTVAGRGAAGECGFDADAALAMLGLTGPGGWLALAGRAGALAHEVERQLPGVHLVAINPPAGVHPGGEVSVVRAAAWPLKASSLRGVVIGADAGEHAAAAIASVLPGLRAIGEAAPPVSSGHLALEATAPGAWVARRR